MLKSSPPDPQNVTIWRKDLERSNEVNLKSLEWAQFQYDWCPYKKEIRTQSCTERRPCEDTERRRLSSSQGERRPQEKRTLLTPSSWTPSLQNGKKLNFCSLSLPVWGTLLWRPQPTKHMPLMPSHHLRVNSGVHPSFKPQCDQARRDCACQGVAGSMALSNGRSEENSTKWLFSQGWTGLSKGVLKTPGEPGVFTPLISN